LSTAYLVAWRSWLVA